IYWTMVSVPVTRTSCSKPASAKSERERFYTGIEKLNRNGAVDDWLRLPNQLVQPRFARHTVAALVDVQTMRGARWLPVNRDAKADRCPGPRRPHDEMHVPGVEAIRDVPGRCVQDRRLPADRPVAPERPLIEGQP